jgi:hypothetical protein
VLVVRFAGEPIAQAFVLRWVLEGGISTDRFSLGGFHASTVSPFGGAWNVWGLSGGLLFGTLLGPEATGTGSFGPVFVCFWFPAQSGSGPR